MVKKSGSKGFLRPTIAKSILFVVLFIIIINILPCKTWGSIPPDYGSKWGTCGFDIILYGLGGQTFSAGDDFLGIIGLGQYGIPIFILLLIISYILSALIIYRYNKSK